MSNQKCKRCGGEEHIPTHQTVKFDAELRDLCASCWSSFREWFHSAPKREPACAETN